MTTPWNLSRLSILQAKLGSVIGRGARPFGFEGHQLRLLPVADEGDVAAFEELYGVSLPDDYRTFLLGVGSGGAGPGYGLVPYDSSPSYERADFPPDQIAAPFPFTESHLLDLDHPPEESSAPPGTLVLSHEGCGYLHLLIVSGGHISDRSFIS